MTNNEDCSTTPDGTINEDDYQNCGLLDGPDGPLLDPRAEARWLQTLKRRPDAVSALVVSGDSLADAIDMRDAERDGYLASKGHPKTCFQGATICRSRHSGTAGWGRRYQRYADELRTTGAFHNVCDPDGIPEGFARFGRQLSDQFQRRCGP